MLVSLFLSSSAQTCTKYTFASNKLFKACNDLPFLNAFLHWTYDPSSGDFQIAYRHTQITPSSWVSWAINPSGVGMIGAQALVAFQKSDGAMRVYTSPVIAYTTTLQEGDLSFPVSDLSATFSNNEIIIFATLKLQNASTLNQVWQDGPLVGDKPGRHDTSGDNIQSAGSLNLLSGEPGTTGGGGNSKTKKRNVSKGFISYINFLRFTYDDPQLSFFFIRQMFFIIVKTLIFLAFGISCHYMLVYMESFLLLFYSF